ncbi:MAG TPA: PilZ domain-containing protein [Sporosarcina psychrophila]|uniref:PilZ domain-containing protein n=1 Tax=Sporosarcina psychrophila TaxID=1476 RepID=A0A921KDQ2_SPOPS|nr:PilZ domain-containing protein [Sporosarcina psychrophila]
MLYKRTEYFRYTFGEPLEAKFQIVVENGTDTESSPGECHFMDISPGGAKLFAKFNIPLEREAVRLHIKFTLHEKLIDLQGVIVWKKPYSGGYMYGYDFDEDPAIEQLIVEELKLRRRSEVNAGSAVKEEE